ncbi:MAG: flagellar filament capping protein FliD [Proteobacteria bacterium]|nr:flagellar filament capping protein FliD [Pseudomonadota bacterium]
MIKTSLITTLCALILLLTACGEDPGFDKFAASPSGGLRFINAINDSPSLIVEFGQQSIGSVAFGDMSAVTNVIPDLDRATTINYIKSNQLETISTFTSSVAENQLKTLILVGTMTDPQVIEVIEDITPPDETDTTTTLLIAHAASNSGTINIEVSDANLETPLITRLTMNPGELSDRLTLAGTDQLSIVASDSEGNVLWRSNTFAVSTGIRPIVVLFDAFGPQSGRVQALYTNFSGTLTFPNEDFVNSTRIINTIPDQTAIDVYQRTAISSEPSVVIIEAEPDAATNTYTVSVEQLAQPATYQLSESLATRTTAIGSGTLTVTNGDTTVDIVIPDDGDTAEAVVNAINGSGGPLTANLITLDDEQVLIQLTALAFRQSGDLLITVDDDDSDDTDALGLSQLSTAQLETVSESQDALLTIDGINYSQPTNLISDVIPSINLYLLGVSTENSEITLSVTQQTLMAEDLLFGDISEYLASENNRIIVTATVANDPSTELYTDALTLANGQYQRLTITGLGDDISGAIATEAVRPVATEARLSILHAAPSTPLVDIYILRSDIALDDANPAGNDIQPLSTGQFGLTPDTYSIVITDPNDKTVLAGPVTIEAQPNAFFEIVVLDAAGGGSPIQLLQLDND